MPLKKGKSKKTIGRNIRELHKGKTYARTARKFGKKKADKQAVAIAMRNMRHGMKMPKSMMGKSKPKPKRKRKKGK